MTISERTCEWCEEEFTPKKKKQKYCSNTCKMEALHGKATYGKRLHDGTRLLSDDFGELNGDESVTFQR